MSVRERFVAVVRGWLRLGGIVRAIQPDIVHVHSLPNPVAVPFLLRIPRLIVSAWGSDVVSRDRRKVRWYPLLLAHAAAVTATGQDLARVTASYLKRPRAIDVIAFGIDTTHFRPLPHVVHRPFTIGYLKRLEPIAGPDVLLQAFARLGAAPDGKLPYLLLGGDGAQRDQLEDMARSLGVADRVFFRGQIAQSAAPRFLAELDLFVMPSRAEAFGVAALEASACGLAVVASRVGGVPEVVAEDVTGVLVPPEDVAALELALERLMGDEALRRRLGAAGPAWVRQRYCWQHNIDQMLAVYERVVRT